MMDRRALSKNANSLDIGDTTRPSAFLEIGHDLCALFARSGIETIVTRSSELTHFRALDAESQERVLRMMKITLECGLAMENNHVSVTRNRTLAWRVMSAMGFKPTSDAFDLIDETDILEIYDADGKIVFATPIFFDLTSYAMEDLYCRPWTLLWGRAEQITGALMAKVGETLKAGNERTIPLDIPEHEVVELSSLEKRRAIVKPRLFSPVKDRFGQRGFISVNTLVELY